MANGHACLQLVEQARDAPAGTEVETRIGVAVASAACGLCYSLGEYQNGGLTDKTRMVNGERIAAVALLRLDSIGSPGLDFFEVARVEAAKILRTYFDADFYRTYGVAAGETTIDEIISSVLEITKRVVAIELEFRAN
jgi:hypothetical protein